MVRPYKEIQLEKGFIRIFESNVNESELVWHRDKKDRVVIPLHSTDWKLQMDNELPKKFEKRKPIFIEAKKFHRLHAGKGKLITFIYES